MIAPEERPAQSTSAEWLDSLVATPAPAAPDQRPVVEVALRSDVDTSVYPPIVVVRLTVRGQPPRVYRGQRSGTASEASLAVLAYVVRRLPEPMRISLCVDDPTVDRILAGAAPTPPWLRRATLELSSQMALGDVSIHVDCLDLGDCLAPPPHGVG